MANLPALPSPIPQLMNLYRSQLGPFSQALEERQDWIMEAASLLRSNFLLSNTPYAREKAAQRLEEIAGEILELRIRIGG